MNRATVSIPVASTAYKSRYNKKHPDTPMKNGIFTFAVDASNGSVRSILERCLSGEYTMCASELVDSERGLFIHLVYQFDAPKQKELNPGRICGVDLGVKYAAVCAISDMPDRKLFVNGENVIQHCIKLESKRKKVQKLAKYDTHDGHGRKPKTQLSRSIRNKQSDYQKTTNRKYAKDIVDFARKNGCGEIRMEDLSGFSGQHKGDKFLGKWTYYQLQDYITQKADHYGINVVKVKPKDTSRRCSICGYIDKDNRTSQEEFKCLKCGFKANADFNAARNIATWAEKLK
jgi:IS605 OrfB family transposase